MASRYSDLFELLKSPYTLMILDYMFENRNKKHTLEDLIEITKSVKSKISYICEELVDLNVLDRDYEGDQPVYEALDSRYGNLLEKIIEAID